EGMAHFTPEVLAILSDTKATTEMRLLKLFFAPSETSQSAGRAWLGRIAARRRDREPARSPLVATAQGPAVPAWGRSGANAPTYLSRIVQPVLVVNGHDDIMVPTVNSFILQQELPNAQLILYPDSGHAAQFQYSTVFAEEVARFMG